MRRSEALKYVARELVVGEQFPARLVVEVTADGGHHAVLPEEGAHGVELAAVLALQRQQVAHLVVAVGDVDAGVAVEDLVAVEAQFARVGVHHGDAVPLLQKPRQGGLLVRAFPDVLRLDQADVVAVAADGARVIEQHLQEQVALVARQFDVEPGIVGEDASARRRA